MSALSSRRPQSPAPGPGFSGRAARGSTSDKGAIWVGIRSIAHPLQSRRCPHLSTKGKPPINSIKGLSDNALLAPFRLDGRSYYISTERRGNVYSASLHESRAGDAVAYFRGRALIDGEPSDNRAFLKMALLQQLTQRRNISRERVQPWWVKGGAIVAALAVGLSLTSLVSYCIGHVLEGSDVRDCVATRR
jgi:hypothetical protein